MRMARGGRVVYKRSHFNDEESESSSELESDSSDDSSDEGNFEFSETDSLSEYEYDSSVEGSFEFSESNWSEDLPYCWIDKRLDFYDYSFTEIIDDGSSKRKGGKNGRSEAGKKKGRKIKQKNDFASPAARKRIKKKIEDEVTVSTGSKRKRSVKNQGKKKKSEVEKKQRKNVASSARIKRQKTTRIEDEGGSVSTGSKRKGSVKNQGKKKKSEVEKKQMKNVASSARIKRQKTTGIEDEGSVSTGSKRKGSVKNQGKKKTSKVEKKQKNVASSARIKRQKTTRIEDSDDHRVSVGGKKKRSKIVRKDLTFESPVVIIVFDIETTGFGRDDRIIEIAFGDLMGGKNSTFQTLVNPGKIIKNSNIHGITTNMVNRPGVPSFKKLLPILLQYVRSRQMDGKPVLLVAHSARRFDVPFIIKEFRRCSVEVPEDWLFLDTIPLARQLVKPDGSKLPSVKLDDLRKYYGIRLKGRAHRAMQDVNTLSYVLQSIIFDLKLTVHELINKAFRASDITIGAL